MSPIHPGSADLMEVIQKEVEEASAEAVEGLSLVIPSLKMTPTASMVRKKERQKGSGGDYYIRKGLNQSHSDLSLLKLVFRRLVVVIPCLVMLKPYPYRGTLFCVPVVFHKHIMRKDRSTIRSSGFMAKYLLAVVCKLTLATTMRCAESPKHLDSIV